ncbi:unnamed protein product [Boreogadus saida]
MLRRDREPASPRCPVHHLYEGQVAVAGPAELGRKSSNDSMFSLSRKRCSWAALGGLRGREVGGCRRGSPEKMKCTPKN